MVAIVPAVWVLLTAGESGTYQLLILSQVILSLQLPFAIVPLIHFTSDRRLMGEFVNRSCVAVLAWIVASIIITLNIQLVVEQVSAVLTVSSSWLVKTTILLGSSVLIGLLAYITIKPFLDRTARGRQRPKVFTTPEEGARLELEARSYKKIGVTIAFSDKDKKVLSEAVMLAKQHHAELYLFHVVEGAGGVVYGGATFDAEAREDDIYLRRVADALSKEGIEVYCELGFGNVPKAIVRLAQQHQIELLVMGGHGHRGLLGMLMGKTISPVRYELNIPVLIVR